MQDSRHQVKDSLEKQSQEVDHEVILASLQEEIDNHNAVKNDLKDTMRKSKHSDRRPSSNKFRFKHSVHDPRKRRKHHHSSDYPTPPQDDHPADEDIAHPFPREPTNPDRNPDLDSRAAFRESLFDALADDEGASYWEGVYSQPIHIYPRPTSTDQNGVAGGVLDEMDDEAYVDYVKLKMWERKHPEIVLERERSARKKREEEEAKTRRREEFVRHKEQAAWERSQGRRARVDEDEDEREFAGGKEWSSASERGRERAREQEYLAAWSQYRAAWSALKEELSIRQFDDASTTSKTLSIPWPVLPTKPVIKANIEAFMRRVPVEPPLTKLQMLKAERVRWHPDKIQQRFGGGVDEGTMKIVTGIFQVVDTLVEEERKKS